MSAAMLRPFLAYLLRGRLAFPGGHRTPAGHTVPARFAGVGVAASPDPLVDEWIIATLNQAGIANVRLDFTYGDAEGPAGRLLGRLLDAGFHVVLHLLQPAEAARKMPDAAAGATWQKFVSATLDAWGKRLAMVEACSTINRRRWAGYTPDGFFAAWDIAWQEVRQRGLLLAGPSITDFEPPWSIGILAGLQARGRLPDIHTDNLFAERATEPERDDPKVLGPRLSGLLRMNLVKKARLLQRIGADFGVPRLFSPSAFWTLPRIGRLLPATEQKQADYLTRYLVLAAASGALEGAWWGPLICHREGLVDDGVSQYPTLERITHYAAVDGALADFRPRPALAALAAFNARIPGLRYLGCLAGGDGLEVHAFATADGGLTHVAWTINGRAAALVDVYDVATLAAACFHDRDGAALAEAPTLLTEMPVYIDWPTATTVALQPGAGLLPDVAIDVHGGKALHFFRADGWQGIVAAETPAAAQALLAALPPASLQVQRAAVLRHARNAIWSLPDPRDPAVRLVVKQPVKMHLHKQWLDRFKPSKALRSWSGTCELQRRGIGVAPPVAWFEKIGDTTLKQNFYVCEYVEAEFSVRQMLSALAAGEATYAGLPAASCYRQLCAFLLRLHGSGMFFRDLSGGNILVKKQADGDLVFALIDTGRIRVFSQALPLRLRLADLVRVCNKLHWAGREQLLDGYFSAIGEKLSWRHRLAFMKYDLKVVAKRRIGRKAFGRLFGK